MTKRIMNKNYLLLGLILFLIFLFRFPSLFEPFWYGDEGIFAAVANNLNHGGVLYQTAWDNKPPMIYLTYAAIFKFFGVSMFALRMVTAVLVLAVAVVIFEIAKEVIGERRALIATFLFGLLSSLRLLEGNLALTEIFMLLPISLAMFWAIKRNFDLFSLFLAGLFLAIASLYKQVGALEAAALALFLFLNSKNFLEFSRKGATLSLGFVFPYLAVVVYFAPKNLLGDYIFAAYTYYRIYLGESPQYAIIINVLKFLPVVAALLWGLNQKFKGKLGIFHLILLWGAFSFLGSYFSGRTYGHYLVQAVPAVSILLASISVPFKLKINQVIFSFFYFVPLIFLTKLLFTDFLSGGPINQLKYWQNFSQFAIGHETVDDYNNFFDRNVNSILGLADFLKQREAKGEIVYIWGDYPWLYAIADLKNPTRYVTSFHVFGVPDGRRQVTEDLIKNPPKYIIIPPTNIGRFFELENLLAQHYTHLGQIENSEVWQKAD